MTFNPLRTACLRQLTGQAYQYIFAWEENHPQSHFRLQQLIEEVWRMQDEDACFFWPFFHAQEAVCQFVSAHAHVIRPHARTHLLLANMHGKWRRNRHKIILFLGLALAAPRQRPSQVLRQMPRQRPGQVSRQTPRQRPRHMHGEDAVGGATTPLRLEGWADLAYRKEALPVTSPRHLPREKPGQKPIQELGILTLIPFPTRQSQLPRQLSRDSYLPRHLPGQIIYRDICRGKFSGRIFTGTFAAANLLRQY